MSPVDYILDGLQAALELERELGVRSVEFDRALLRVEPSGGVAPAKPASASQGPVEPARAARSGEYDFVFLHDRPLSPRGVEMMAKIILAMGRTAETAPIVIAPPIPKAKMAIVLGGLALRKFLPGLRGEPGQWIKSPGGRDVLVTYSPEYILRFGAVTPAVEQIKKAMWKSLKTVMQRLKV